MTLSITSPIRATSVLSLAVRLAPTADIGRQDGSDMGTAGSPPTKDYYERSLKLGSHQTIDDLLTTLRTIAMPMDIASIPVKDVNKYIDYFESTMRHDNLDDKLFIGRNGADLTTSPKEYLEWMQAKVTAETDPGLDFAPDDHEGFSAALAKLPTEEERHAFLLRNSVEVQPMMVSDPKDDQLPSL
jgi:hypothetical protein